MITAENWKELLAEIAVAPFVGAWIETRKYYEIEHVSEVAPFVGAWIETVVSLSLVLMCHVAPFVGAWIETCVVVIQGPSAILSLPSWERGLKRTDVHIILPDPVSLPSWERGLKPIVCALLCMWHVVAPFVGAWIETGYILPPARTA